MITLAGERVVLQIVDTSKEFKLETDTYKYVRRTMGKKGWRCQRIDTVAQMGFPDMLLTKGLEYLQIEAKLQKTQSLTNLSTNLRWEPGQLAYAKLSIRNKEPYVLLIGTGTTLKLVYGEYATEYSPIITLMDAVNGK